MEQFGLPDDYGSDYGSHFENNNDGIEVPSLTWEEGIELSKEVLKPFLHLNKMTLPDVRGEMLRAKTPMLQRFSAVMEQHYRRALDQIGGSQGLTMDTVRFLEEKGFFPVGFFDMIAYSLIREHSFVYMDGKIQYDEDYGIGVRAIFEEYLEVVDSDGIDTIRDGVLKVLMAHEGSHSGLFSRKEDQLLFLTTLLKNFDVYQERLQLDEWVRVAVYRWLNTFNTKLYEDIPFAHSGFSEFGEKDVTEGYFADLFAESDPDSWKNGDSV